MVLTTHRGRLGQTEKCRQQVARMSAAICAGFKAPWKSRMSLRSSELRLAGRTVGLGASGDMVLYFLSSAPYENCIKVFGWRSTCWMFDPIRG